MSRLPLENENASKEEYKSSFTEAVTKVINIEDKRILDSVTSGLQTDYTRALNFKDYLKGDSLFNADMGQSGSFMHYNGKAWETDKQAGALINKAFAYSEVLSHLSANEEEIKLLAATIKAFQNDTSRRGIIRTLKPLIQVKQSQFDNNSKLLNLENCTIDLNTQKAREHSKNDMITKLAAGCVYDEKADMTLMKSVIDSCFENNKDDIKAFETMLGGALLGELSIMPIWYGSGDNGKSLIIKVITDTLGLSKNGGYIATPSVKLFLKSKMENASEAATPGLYLMRNCKIAFTGEAPKGSIWDDSLIKKIATHEYDTFRQLNQESIQDRYTCTLINDTNNLPHINSSDHGMTKRLKVYKFPHTFVKGVDMDVTLEERLKNDKPGVIRYLLYCVEQFINNDREPFYSENVIKESQCYKENNDIIQDFISECLLMVKGKKETKANVFKAYKNWCGTNNYSCKISSKDFGKELKARGIDVRKSNTECCFDVTLRYEAFGYDFVEGEYRI